MKEMLITRKRIDGLAPLAAGEAPLGEAVLDEVLLRIPRGERGIKTVEWTRVDREDDGFCIVSDGETLAIHAGRLRAALYACHLLNQYAGECGGLLPVGEIECVPRCGFRSLKLYLPDEQRLDEFRAIIDLACRYRVNTILLELGGGMEYKRHPEINEAWKAYCRDMTTYPQRANDVQNSCAWDKNSIHFENAGGGVLSQETVRGLVDYCRARDLEVIPEQPTLSHSDYILCAHPELAERSDDPYPDAYCPSNPETYKLVFELLDEVLEVFEPKIVHIGHDEYYSMCVCPRCRGKNAAEVYAGDVARIHDYLAAKGVQTMLWAEKLLDAVDVNGARYGGSEMYRNDERGEFHRPATWPAADLIPKDVICMHWYWGIDRRLDDALLGRGFPMVYGNYNALGMVDWANRSRAGVLGGGPSHWSSLEWTTFQRNSVAACLLCASMMFWTDEYREDNFPELLEAIFADLYELRNEKTLCGPHLRITHTTDVQRPYVYISSQPMELEHDQIGHYAVEWANGERMEIPILYGVNVTNAHRCWTRALDREHPGMNGADSYRFDSLLVETAGTALPIRRPNETVFQFTAPNPHPESEIVSVRVVKTAPDDGAIRLIALKACPGEA